MTTTTEYGTWVTVGDRTALSVECTVEEALGSEGPEGFDVDAIVAEYREAINEALPDGVSLNGNTFYGPYYQKDAEFDMDSLNIREIVESVDLWSIIEEHDKS